MSPPRHPHYRELEGALHRALDGWIGDHHGKRAGHHFLDHFQSLGGVSCQSDGAFLGGFLFGLLTGRGTRFDWNIGSFVVAAVGAVVLLFILRLVRRA
jgi:hypothetical protein